MFHKPFPVPRAQAWMGHVELEQLQAESHQHRPLSSRGTRSRLLGDPASYRGHNRAHPRQAAELKPALAGGSKGEPSILHQPRSMFHPPHLAASSTVCWGSSPSCRPPRSTEPPAPGSDAQAPHQEVSAKNEPRQVNYTKFSRARDRDLQLVLRLEAGFCTWGGFASAHEGYFGVPGRDNEVF